MASTAARPAVRRTPACHAGERIASYEDQRLHEREIITLPGAHGSTLVIDRLACTECDQRLVAHLAADEPFENARIVTQLYLADRRARRCRQVHASDFELAPLPAAFDEGVDQGVIARAVIEHQGCCYALEGTPIRGALAQLRWQQQRGSDADGAAEVVTLRQLVGVLERYEPARWLTAVAIEMHKEDARVSVTVLRAELERLTRSPIVLNRGLREAVLAATRRDGLSMSEIAMRCGRRKHDANGAESGETSWLARRIGALPEGGQDTPTPWVHSDVLALIARDGLGLAPCEVEVQ